MRVVYFLKRFKNVIKTAVQALIISAAHDVARPFGRNRQRARSVAVGEEGGGREGGWGLGCSSLSRSTRGLFAFCLVICGVFLFFVFKEAAVWSSRDVFPSLPVGFRRECDEQRNQATIVLPVLTCDPSK